ncbi:similar to Saccharomyces cerevisiae YGR246C BRF1 TFIIIB B-related factor [Maudiozyma saulgeensis]|uniref:Transcription factor IIIB 70 kDa subunit n=1 Tax=Maudiozyma saulgeensis TaxID=1789683 RepID=A0A1X7R684_9SACH|nr:similar to Saccharomyces cerevisiae YGR246C BRF1 TFIIIB B-related factor [Kazachstania saulgeensis]
MAVCKVCKGTEFVRDHSNANNDLVCKNCGVVSEDNPIVSEVTFGETSAGAAVVQGSFISAGQSHASFLSHGGSSALESREATLNNARRKLRAVSHALRIPEYITDAAFQWYKLALANNFVQGRRSQNVIATCLYVACRKEKTHHMLIDFSSRLQVSVYSIGATFLKMVKKLHITKLPLADPSLFIQHFAEKLNLGDKMIKVVKDAVKLSQRMSDDWMYEGRRPAGIAGACVLLACRMNNLRRTHSEIVAVSHVAENTIQQRLNEFKKSKASKMSIKEFREDDSKDSESRPPSFHKNRQNEKRIKTQLAKVEAKETSEEALNRNPILSQFMTAQDLSSKEVLFYLKQFTKKRENTVKRIKATHGIDDEDMLVQDGFTKKVTPMENHSSDESSNEDADNISRLDRRSRRKRRRLHEDDIEVKVEEDENEEEVEVSEVGTRNWRTRGQKKLFVAQEEINKERREQIEEDELAVGRSGHFQDEIDGYSLETDPYRPRNLHLLPTTQSMLESIADDPDNLEDVDDEELDAVILDEDAVRLKERIWVGINEEYLLEQENKRLKEEADQLAGNTSNKKRRAGNGNNRGRKRNNAQDLPVVHTAVGVMSQLEDKSGLQAALRAAEESGDLTTADSVKNMLQKASFSRKINYDAIDGLFNQPKSK